MKTPRDSSDHAAFKEFLKMIGKVCLIGFVAIAGVIATAVLALRAIPAADEQASQEDTSDTSPMDEASSEEPASQPEVEDWRVVYSDVPESPQNQMVWLDEADIDHESGDVYSIRGENGLVLLNVDDDDWISYSGMDFVNDQGESHLVISKEIADEFGYGVFRILPQKIGYVADEDIIWIVMHNGINQYSLAKFSIVLKLNVQTQTIEDMYHIPWLNMVDCHLQDGVLYIYGAAREQLEFHMLDTQTMALASPVCTVNKKKLGFTSNPMLEISPDGHMLLRGDVDGKEVLVNAQAPGEKQFRGVWEQIYDTAPNGALLFIGARSYTYRAPAWSTDPIQYISGNWSLEEDGQVRVSAGLQVLLEDDLEIDVDRWESTFSSMAVDCQVIEWDPNALPTHIRIGEHEYRYVTAFDTPEEVTAEGDAMYQEVMSWLGQEKHRDNSDELAMTNALGNAAAVAVSEGDRYMGLRVDQIINKEKSYRNNWRPEMVALSFTGKLTLTGTIESYESHAYFMPDQDSLEKIPQAMSLLARKPATVFNLDHDSVAYSLSYSVEGSCTVVVDRLQLRFVDASDACHSLRILEIAEEGHDEIRPEESEYSNSIK